MQSGLHDLPDQAPIPPGLRQTPPLTAVTFFRPTYQYPSCPEKKREKKDRKKEYFTHHLTRSHVPLRKQWTARARAWPRARDGEAACNSSWRWMWLQYVTTRPEFATATAEFTWPPPPPPSPLPQFLQPCLHRLKPRSCLADIARM